jgi:ATP-binding cassette subfamily C protein/ATP-binding cassette subfamily C protein LapB
MYRVSFRHPGATEPVLFGVTLTIPDRGFVALIGPGGSGPSATLPLLAGLHRPQSGKVLLGGQDLQSLHPSAVRKRISYLTKDNAIFYGTIAQNLRLAAPLASDEELERVCRDTGLLEDIRSLPKGWDTPLGDLETGQFSRSFVRRLALARALLTEGDILLLDEPERDLDARGVEAMTALLTRLKGEKTIVMVSYRPSFIHMADTVHVFQQGRPVMEGAPAEAMALARQIA